MSGMNLLENQVRYSLAISILNRIRHWLKGRVLFEELEKELDIINESFELNEKDNTSQALLYSFQGFPDKEKAVSVQIAQVFNSVIEQLFSSKGERREKYELIKDFFLHYNKYEGREDVKELIVTTLVESIHLISGESMFRNTRVI